MFWTRRTAESLGLLALALLAGVFAGHARAARSHRRLIIPDLVAVRLVPVSACRKCWSFSCQARATRGYGLSAAVVVTSQGLLLYLFGSTEGIERSVYRARLGRNLSVILINGGLTPISPDTIYKLEPRSMLANGNTVSGSAAEIKSAVAGNRDEAGIFADRIGAAKSGSSPCSVQLGRPIIAGGIFLILLGSGWYIPATGALQEAEASKLEIRQPFRSDRQGRFMNNQGAVGCAGVHDRLSTRTQSIRVMT